MAYKSGVILTTYKSWDDLSSSSSHYWNCLYIYTSKAVTSRFEKLSTGLDCFKRFVENRPIFWWIPVRIDTWSTSFVFKLYLSFHKNNESVFWWSPPPHPSDWWTSGSLNPQIPGTTDRHNIPVFSETLPGILSWWNCFFDAINAVRIKLFRSKALCDTARQLGVEGDFFVMKTYDSATHCAFFRTTLKKACFLLDVHNPQKFKGWQLAEVLQDVWAVFNALCSIPPFHRTNGVNGGRCNGFRKSP